MSEETKVKKPFFKSVSFKCIVVLLIIALVSGIFLTICNSLFEVTDTERLERALGKLYDSSETVSNPTEEEIDTSISVDDATINNVYKITSIDGEYVLNITGNGGFSGGTVTCYVRIYVGSTACEVKSISISSNVGQSYIAKIGSDDLNALVSQQSTSGFTAFSTDGITCGATYSLTAVTNATNAALTYMNAKYLGVTSADPFEGFEYLDYINKNSTSYSVSNGVVTYSIKTKTKGNSGSFTITITVDSTETVTTFTTSSKSDDGYIMYDTGNYVGMSANDILELLDLTSNSVSGSTLATGASDSNFLCAYAALFATANYQNCIGGVS